VDVYLASQRGKAECGRTVSTYPWTRSYDRHRGFGALWPLVLQLQTEKSRAISVALGGQVLLVVTGLVVGALSVFGYTRSNSEDPGIFPQLHW
jgi:hypothetical protein